MKKPEFPIPSQDSKSDCNPLVVLGFSARAAAECAVQAGHRPIVVDFCGDLDLTSLGCRYHSMADPAWLDWLVDQPTSGPVLITGGMEHQSLRLYDYFRRTGRSCDAIESVVAMRAIKNWQRWAQESDIVWPKSIAMADAPLLQAPTMDSHSRWVLKSHQSVGGQGVHDWPIDNATSSHRFLDDSQNCYLQQKQQGTGVGVTFLTSDFGTIVLGGAESGFEDTQSFMPKYTYRGSIGPCQLSEASLARLRSFGQRVGSEARILGLWQADFIVHPEFIALLEINPRWSASMELLDVAMEERLVGWHVACVNKSVKLSEWHALSLRCDQRILATPQRALGKLIHYAPCDFVVSKSQASQWWEVRWDSGNTLPAESAWFAADIPPANTQVTQGHPIRTSMIVGKTKEQVVAVGTQLSNNG